jgi:hypothetical protein
MRKAADRIFKVVSAVFAAGVFPTHENVPVGVRHLLSLGTIWPARIRGQCMATSDFRTYGIFR